MKKNFTATIVMLVMLISTEAKAQQPYNPMREGTWMGIFGVGIGNTYGTYSGGNSGFGMKISLERGIWEAGPGVIALGGEFGYAHSSSYLSTYDGRYTFGYNNVNIAMRGAWHCGWDLEGLDTYAGIPMGLSFGSLGGSNAPQDHRTGSSVFFYTGIFIGGSYFFTQEFGVNMEFGYSTTLFQVGIVYRF